MKRIILIIFIGTLFISTAHAQFSFGVKGGLTVSDMNLDVFPDTAVDAIFGYHAGVYFKVFDGLFSLQPEIMYVRKGMNLNDLESDWYTRYQFHYIDVPVLLRISVPLKNCEIYFNLGPYFGYAISGKLKENRFDEEQNAWVETESTCDFETCIESRFDYGAAMGAGITYKHFLFDVRYNNGLAHVGDPDRFDSSNHKYLNVSLGYQFK